MRHRIHDQIFWLSCIAIAFFLPVFGRIVPICIVIMVLNWLIDGRFIYYVQHLCTEKERILTLSFASLYILYVAGLIYTTNFEYGWLDLEIKLSLLVFPIVFATSYRPLFSEKRRLWILGSFVSGCLAGALILLLHATINEYSNGIAHSFYYMNLAWYFHTTYLSMYYNFALAFLLLLLLRKIYFTPLVTAFIVILIGFLFGMILLLVSKAGMLTIIMVILYIAIYAFFILRQIKTGIAVIGGGLMLFFLAYLVVPVTFSRVSSAERIVTSAQQVNRVKAESNADRMAVWSVAIGIIKKNFFFGVGTGDVKDALMEGYRKNRVISALEHKFNAHNQYLQTFVTLGLAGFLLLIALLLLAAIRAYRNHQELYFIFLSIFALNMLFESMLEIQAGVVFYAFFNSLLFAKIKNGDPVSWAPAESK